MSHELRTPLNSMLILSQQLAEDPKNLTPKQVEYARTIHASGGDLLLLINDILDLAKVESGTMTLDLDNLPFTEMREHMDRFFRHVAESRGLQFSIEFDPQLGSAIHTDSKRLEQVLRNLLSNAFKFTQKGQVRLKVAPASGGWSSDHPVLSKADGSHRLFRHRHGHRHCRGQAKDHLSRPSSRPKAAPAANTAARGWGYPSAANWPSSWGAN